MCVYTRVYIFSESYVMNQLHFHCDNAPKC